MPAMGHRPAAGRADDFQRVAGAEPGGQGGGERRRLAEDDDRQVQGAPWRPDDRAPGRADRPGQHRRP